MIPAVTAINSWLHGADTQKARPFQDTASPAG